MRLIKLKDIESGTLIDSSIADNTFGGTAVSHWFPTDGNAAKGHIRYYATGEIKYVYKAKQDIAANPAANPPPDDPANWQLIGSCDRWAMFDRIGNTKSSATNSFSVKVDSGGTDCVGLFGLTCKEVTLTLTAQSETKKTETIGLQSPISSASWYTWFFEPIEYKTLLLWEYPKYATSTLTVVFNNTGSTAECAVMRWGKIYDIGTTQTRATGDLVDHATKKYSGGMVVIEPNKSADIISFNMFINHNRNQKIKELFQSIAGKPSIFDCNNSNTDQEDVIVYALFKRLIRLYSTPKFSLYNGKIEELI